MTSDLAQGSPRHILGVSLITWRSPSCVAASLAFASFTRDLCCFGAPEVQTWGLCLGNCVLICAGFSGVQPGVQAPLTEWKGWVGQGGVQDSWRGDRGGRLQS